jgi:hypothetical protein
LCLAKKVLRLPSSAVRYFCSDSGFTHTSFIKFVISE